MRDRAKVGEGGGLRGGMRDRAEVRGRAEEYNYRRKVSLY